MIQVRVRLAALAVLALLALPGAAHMHGNAELVLARGPEKYCLSLAELEAMTWTTIVTENEYADGMVTYRGPLARDVIAGLGLDVFDTLRFTAANDYYIDIPTKELETYDVILAMEADGERLSRRDKGPLWLMYPISDHSALRQPIYSQRLIWQVVEIAAQ